MKKHSLWKSDTLDYRVSPTCQPILVAREAPLLYGSTRLESLHGLEAVLELKLLHFGTSREMKAKKWSGTHWSRVLGLCRHTGLGRECTVA